MIAELWENLKTMFNPYTFEDYVRDHNPQSVYELEQLEKDFDRLAQHFCFSPKY